MTIHQMYLSALWPNRTRLQVMSPRISLKRTPLCRSKPMFFHGPSMTSTCDSAESIATPPPKSDLDDEQIRNMLDSPLYFEEKQVPTDHEFVTPTEKTQCQVHLTSEQVQGDLQQCPHTRGSRVKNHLPTEKVFSCTSSSSRRR